MINQDQINQWLLEGTISQEQAQKMISDVTQKSEDERSNKFVVAISTIGSILLGIGAIFFIASNWDGIPDFFKIIILAGSTFGAYYLGYLFKYDKQNLPRVGASLFFLGALLFGASIFLIAQMYNVNANNHTLILIWLIGVLPLVYAFGSESIAALSALLFLTWIGLFIFRNGDVGEYVFFSLPVIYLSSGLLLFGIGGLHYFAPAFQKIARMFRISGIKVAMLSLFLLTFEFFSKHHTESYYYGSSKMIENMTSQLTAGVVLFSVIAIIALVINLFFNPSHSETSPLENGTALGLIVFTLLFFFFPSSSVIYTIIYSLIFALLTLLFIYIGYKKADIKLVNMGTFWLSLFIIARYFDFFWDLMDRSLFFIIGGLILVLGGIALEKKRRQIKTQFISPQIQIYE